MSKSMLCNLGSHEVCTNILADNFPCDCPCHAQRTDMVQNSPDTNLESVKSVNKLEDINKGE